MNSRLYIIYSKKHYLIFLDNKLFFKQNFLSISHQVYSSNLLTHIYILKLLSRFGLINCLKK